VRSPIRALGRPPDAPAAEAVPPPADLDEPVYADEYAAEPAPADLDGPVEAEAGEPGAPP
jgi:hypothetical protein